jgi:hypothetical protein
VDSIRGGSPISRNASPLPENASPSFENLALLPPGEGVGAGGEHGVNGVPALAEEAELGAELTIELSSVISTRR